MDLCRQKCGTGLMEWKSPSVLLTKTVGSGLEPSL